MADLEVDAAIIGGGIIGLSCACELRRAGLERVAVLERHAAVGQESSSLANGGVRAQFSTPPNIHFSMYSIAEYERLNARFDIIDFRQLGYLIFTGTEAGESQLRTGAGLQSALGVAVEWLEPAQVLAKAPFLRPEGLRGGTFHARDGFLDPGGVVEAFRLMARELGVTTWLNANVVGIGEGSRGFTVMLADGRDASAGWVVNAAGADAQAVAGHVGYAVPVDPVRRNLAFVQLSDAPAGLIPMCVDIDTGVLVRREPGGGYILAYSDPADPPGRDTTVDPNFLPAIAARIGNRFPMLENATINPHRCWAGLYPETPDHHAIIGATPGVRRFIQAVGFGGHGIMHAPAAGRAVAELVTSGRSATFDVHPLRPSRFVEGDLVVEAAVL